jgi:hypothetical protein
MHKEAVIGLGVAGNFAHHLEQAGELEDFKNVKTAEADAPKGIFPFYLPKSSTFLGTYPICSETLELPNYEANAQVEPEVAVLFDIIYDEQMKVADLDALRFTVFNDCTIRKEGAKKISEKKSWGPTSKGIAREWVEIDTFESGGVMDDYHLCSFVKRDGVVHPYGVDAPFVGYSYFYSKLKNWLIDTMNNQQDFGPLEDIAKHLKENEYPKQALISIGATAYAEFGEKNYLQSADEVFVVAYDARVEQGDISAGIHKLILHQVVS